MILILKNIIKKNELRLFNLNFFIFLKIIKKENKKTVIFSK